MIQRAENLAWMLERGKNMVQLMFYLYLNDWGILISSSQSSYANSTNF